MYKNKLFRINISKKLTCLGLVVLTAIGTVGCKSTANNSSATNTSGDNTLTISVITKDNYLDTAIKKYQEQHPGTIINVKEYTSDPLQGGNEGKVSRRVEDEKSEDIEKYVTAMNTELMSGKGTDIISLNTLPYEKYIDKNLLANLSDMIKDDKSFDLNNYYSNVLDAMKYNGNLYSFPLSININVLEANKALLDKYNIKVDDDKWNWNDFEGIAANIVDGSKKDGMQGIYALSGVDGSMLVSYLVSENYNKFADKNKKTLSFDSKEFIDILNLAKSMIDKNYVNTDTTDGKTDDLTNRGGVVFSPTKLSMYFDLMLTKQVYEGGVDFLKYPGEGDNLSFTATATFGINNKSSNKDLAWDFLKFLVSDEMMSESSWTSFPIKKTASSKAAQDTIDMSKKAIGNDKLKFANKGQVIKITKPLTEEDVNIVPELISKAKKYAPVDQKVLNIVQEESKDFFDGQKTADATAKTIQDRVSTYINE
ncbi:ABC transporter substrate-binding protein [Candidatus Clostridium helianthi]|uniref:ABC transporter substrate-binding protein n=1 Tax=Candidatus Clostridium helianthi TaxID=3381660 RepID=A0ABW8S6V6_9CLOT